MAYSLFTKAHLTFDTLPIFDPASGTLPSVTGTATLTEGVFNNGLQMADDTFISVPMVGFTFQWTVGFWLKPTHPGVATNAGTTYALRQGLLSKCDSSYAANTTTISNVVFCIYEEANADKTKQLKVQVGNATVTSSSYSANEFHHFWISFNGVVPRLKIFIDLIEDTGASTSGSLPSSLPATANAFIVNPIPPGERWRTVRNTAVLDDLVVFDVAYEQPAFAAKAANYGALYVADATLLLSEEIDQAIVFDDVSTIRVNSVFVNRGSLFVSRTDGRLLKGEKLLWHNRRDFNKTAELSQLTRQSSSDGSSSEIINGALIVKNETIRI